MKRLYLSLFLFLMIAEHATAGTDEQLGLIRQSISRIENELLSENHSTLSAKQQLTKIRKLMQLQKQEIHYSEIRMRELTQSMNGLNAQKQKVLENIEMQKRQLYSRLKELNAYTESEPLDANWINAFDAINQRDFYLAKLVEKDLKTVDQLKQNADAAQALELRLIEEKGRVEYYLQELKEQHGLLNANEQVQRDIILTNRSNRLETLKNLKELKSAENELSGIMSRIKKTNEKGFGLAQKKGYLPYPVEGKLLTEFGKSYNSRTNLLTFQKGITLEVALNNPVYAVSEGKVAYSGPLRHYGYIVIVEHPGQYYTLYGQLGQVKTSEGKVVKEGDVLGQTSREPFYFEIRNKNIAVDPLKWLRQKIIISEAKK